MLNFVKDRILRRRLELDEKEIKIGFTATALLITALVANVAYLNFFIINGLSAKSYAPLSVVAIVPSPTAAPASPIPSAAPTAVLTYPSPTPASSRDYFINLGSGANQSTDWADVSGTLMTFDIGQYTNIKEVHLESTVNVPTANGTISVRLFNKTGNYAVWNSDRTVQAQASGDLIISQNIIYDYGPKLYVVQMKSQFGVPATLTQARLHITAQ